MPKHSVRDGRALAASIIRNVEHETHGNLYARPFRGPVWHPGYLPRKFQHALQTGVDYVIRSYGTPIAWRAPACSLDALTEAGAYRSKGTGPSKYEADYVAYQVPGEDRVWIFPNVRYSSSTATHQSTARHALSVLGAHVVRYL